MHKTDPALKAIFDQAAEITSPAERQAYLDKACQGNPDLRRRVVALLDAYEQAGSFLESPPVELQNTIEASSIAEQPGTVIGPYKLLQQIGEGGFGVVFMAEQVEPVRRKVALKIIKPGMDTKEVVARFEAERQALALMDHPNIAQRIRCRGDRVGPAVLRHGTGPRHPDHRLLRSEHLDPQAAVGAVHARVPGRAACPSERDHSPGHQAVQRAGHAPRRHTGRQGDRFRRGQGDRPAAHRNDAVHRFAEMIGTPLYMSPEQAEIKRPGRRHPDATSTRWACCCTSC